MTKHLIKCEEANKKGIEYNAEMRYRGITLGITNALDYVGSKYKSYRIAYVRNHSNPHSMEIIRPPLTNWTIETTGFLGRPTASLSSQA